MGKFKLIYISAEGKVQTETVYAESHSAAKKQVPESAVLRRCIYIEQPGDLLYLH